MSEHKFGGGGGGSEYWQDAVDTFTDLPTTATEGTVILVKDTNKMYIWSGTLWEEFTTTPTSTGDLTESTSSVLTITNGTDAVLKDVTIEVATGNISETNSNVLTITNGTDAALKDVTIEVATGSISEINSNVLTITNGTDAALKDVTIEVNTSSFELIANKNAANGYCPLDANKLVPVTNLPPAALERLVIVADQAARYALTTATVQNGDTVKQTDTNEMFFVKDDTNLSNANGYAVYNAGTASAVAWSGVTSKPTTISGYGITDTIDQTLTGFTSGAGTVSSSDSLKQAIQKVDGNIILNNAKVSDAELSGFVSWGGSGNYYSLSGFQINILRSGVGRIKGTQITWAGTESITLSSHKSYLVGYSATNTITAIDIATIFNSDKEVQYENYKNVFTNNVILFSVWANAAAITKVVKNNHPYNYATNIAVHDHLRFGSVFLDTGAQITLLNAANRTIDSRGADLIDDHGVLSNVPDSTGVAIETMAIWQNASGYAQRAYRRKFTVSGVTVTPTAGATYTNNSSTFTVISASIAAGAGTIETWRSAGTNDPDVSGTLTKASGTGDASITYSAWVPNRVVPASYSNAGVFTALGTGGATRYGIVAIYALPNDLQTPSVAAPVPSYFALLSITAYNSTANAIASIGTATAPVMTQFVMPTEVMALEPVLMGFVVLDGSTRSISNTTSGGFIRGVRSYKATSTNSVTSGAVSVANAINVTTSTTNFDGWLSGSDNDVQLALDTLDETGKDGTFKLRNTASLTKIAAFSCAAITAGNTRTISIPDRDLTLNDIRTTTTTNLTGLLKGNGTSVLAATADTDYASPFVVSAKSANFNAAANYIYLVDSTSIAISVQLPVPALNLRITIKDSGFNANVNNITLVRAGTEKIDGVAASYVIDSAGASVRLVSNGTDWFAI